MVHIGVTNILNYRKARRRLKGTHGWEMICFLANLTKIALFRFKRKSKGMRYSVSFSITRRVTGLTTIGLHSVGKCEQFCLSIESSIHFRGRIASDFVIAYHSRELSLYSLPGLIDICVPDKDTGYRGPSPM